MATPTVSDTPARRQRHRELAAKIGLLKYELHAAGLTLTGHAIETPMQVCGFEIAAQEGGKWPEDVTKAMEEIGRGKRHRDKCRKAGTKP